MLQFMLPLLSAFLTEDLLNLMIYPLFCLYFIATCPALIRHLATWR